MSAVAVAPATGLAEFDALLTSVTLHVVQPDFSYAGDRLLGKLHHTPRREKAINPNLEVALVCNTGGLGKNVCSCTYDFGGYSFIKITTRLYKTF